MKEITFDELSKLIFYREFTHGKVEVRIEGSTITFEDYVCDMEKELEGVLNYARLRRDNPEADRAL